MRTSKFRVLHYADDYGPQRWEYITLPEDIMGESWMSEDAFNWETWGEYVGLIHGKEIFEGDIVVTRNEQQGEYPVEEQYRGVVTYQGDGYHIVQPHDSYTPTLGNYTIVEIEVIGNVHEHPELLEKEESE